MESEVDVMSGKGKGWPKSRSLLKEVLIGRHMNGLLAVPAETPPISGTIDDHTSDAEDEALIGYHTREIQRIEAIQAYYKNKILQLKTYSCDRRKRRRLRPITGRPTRAPTAVPLGVNAHPRRHRPPDYPDIVCFECGRRMSLLDYNSHCLDVHSDPKPVVHQKKAEDKSDANESMAVVSGGHTA